MAQSVRMLVVDDDEGLREYLEAMRALWTEEEAAYDGEFVSFGPSWAWPKPVQSHIPVLVGAAGTEKNFKWIARSARFALPVGVSRHIRASTAAPDPPRQPGEFFTRPERYAASR